MAPLLVALLVAAALSRTRFAWLAVVAAFITMTALTTGFAFTPLTAARKTVLLGIAAPLVGLAADRQSAHQGLIAGALSIGAGIATAWGFFSVLRQMEGVSAVIDAAAVIVWAAVLVALVVNLREDGLQSGAAGLGLGIATGLAGVLSASVGYLLAGAALAASAGALLVIQMVFRRAPPAGFTGALSIGMLAALFATGGVLLAQLPWYALPALLLIPIAARAPTPRPTAAVARGALLCLYTLLAALPVVAIAWRATRRGNS